ncbi:hypothetical protein FQN53_000407 [Emmonsiellopsis sp. PD_33]|nr:hypothetical protein FQN53_000407 [Emmonsiellopsis sp. PD_33]
MPYLHHLPNELLITITTYLDTAHDINALAQANRHLYTLFNPTLYLHNAKHQHLSALTWAARHSILNTAHHAIHASQKTPPTTKLETYHHALAIAIESGSGTMPIINLLLSQPGINPNLQLLTEDEEKAGDRLRLTFLARAAQAGNMPALKRLLPRTSPNSNPPVDPNLGSSTGRTPLSYASSSNHLDAVTYLLSTPGINPDLRDELYGRTPLSYAADSGALASVSALLLRPDVDINAAPDPDQCVGIGWTPLMFATDKMHISVAKRLLSMPCIDVNYRSKLGETALHLAVLRNLEELVPLLLARGVDPDIRGPRDATPLFYAAHCGNLSIARVLCGAGAEPDARTVYRHTPLREAAVCGWTEIVRFLLATGRVDVGARDVEAVTVLAAAAMKGSREIVGLLLGREGGGGKGELGLEARDRQGRNALSYAVGYGDVEIVRMLVEGVEGGVDLEGVDGGGRTLLSYAPERVRGEMGRVLSGG